jgi:hypothetical protein
MVAKKRVNCFKARKVRDDASMRGLRRDCGKIGEILRGNLWHRKRKVGRSLQRSGVGKKEVEVI